MDKYEYKYEYKYKYEYQYEYELYTLCDTIPDYIMGNKQITKHKVCIDIENK